MGSEGEAARALARRLKELREGEWPDASVTQQQLARALRASPALISSWENANAVPPEDRLVAYATFFASRRSVEQQPYELLRAEELTNSERVRRDELRRELFEARATVLQLGTTEAAQTAIEPLGGPWHFGDRKPVIMVCAEVPPEQRRHLPKPDDPDAPYADLHQFADLDALFELHGHIRAANPTSLVKVRKSSELGPDDYASHLVVLGGVDWNMATRNLLRIAHMPIAQASGGLEGSYFYVKGQEASRFAADLTPDGVLVADVGHLFRAPNPINRKRTVTICNGASSRGVLGAVRTLTDEMFRDRNAEYLAERFHGANAYSILMRVVIVDGFVMTPDWTRPDTVLHDWPELGS